MIRKVGILESAALGFVGAALRMRAERLAADAAKRAAGLDREIAKRAADLQLEIQAQLR